MSDDPDKVAEALDYYLSELDEGLAHTAVKGNLERLNQQQPGLIAFYDAMHTDLDALLGLAERNERIVRARVLRELVENPPSKLKLNTTEFKTMMEGDQRVIDATGLSGEIRYVYKQYSSIMSGLTQRGFTLSNIGKIREAGLEEVEV